MSGTIPTGETILRIGRHASGVERATTRTDRKVRIRGPRATLRLVATSPIDRHRTLARLLTPSSEDPSLGDSIVGFTRLGGDSRSQRPASTASQYRILQHLRHGHTIQSDLAFRLTVTKQSVTRLVDTLVDKRYLTRRVDPDDRRRVIHTITPKGQRTLDHADAIIEQVPDARTPGPRRRRRHRGCAARHPALRIAEQASYERVRPDGIVPGPRSADIPPSRAAVPRRLGRGRQDGGWMPGPSMS